MSDLDKKYFGDSSGVRLQHHGRQRHRDAMSVLNSPVGQITSRDQIINPNSILDPSMYQNTFAGRRKYESDLEALKAYQLQQEAAYEEYYNSPEQAAIREREAGINPDLVGLQNAGEAASAPVNENVPGANLPTNGQMILQGVSTFASSFVSMIQGIQGIADLSLFPKKKDLLNRSLGNATLTNTNLGIQNNLLELQEINTLTQMIDSYISDALGTAQQKALDADEDFDPVSWLSDSSNYSELENLFTGTSPHFNTILDNAKNRAIRYQRNAMQVRKDFANDNFDFATIYNNPLYNTNERLMGASMAPYMKMLHEADKAQAEFQKVYNEWQKGYYNAMSATDAAGAVNAQNQYNKDYYDSLDGKLIAAFEQYVRDVEKKSLTLRDTINSNYSDMYNSDPMSEAGQAAAYLFSTGGGQSWQDNYLARNASYMKDMMDTDQKMREVLIDSEYWKRLDIWWRNSNGSVNAAANMVDALVPF